MSIIKRVTKKEFYKVIGPLDVFPTIRNDYGSDFKNSAGIIKGYTIPYGDNPESSYKPHKEYFLMVPE